VRTRDAILARLRPEALPTAPTNALPTAPSNPNAISPEEEAEDYRTLFDRVAECLDCVGYELTAQFLHLCVKRYHPDKNGGSDSDAWNRIHRVWKIAREKT
jgi:hypothetical protein